MEFIDLLKWLFIFWVIFFIVPKMIFNENFDEKNVIDGLTITETQKSGIAQDIIVSTSEMVKDIKENSINVASSVSDSAMKVTETIKDSSSNVMNNLVANSQSTITQILPEIKMTPTQTISFDKYDYDLMDTHEKVPIEQSKPLREDATNEIMQHQDAVFGFVDKINKSSSGGVDTLDKINAIKVNGTNQTGQTISSIYDELTRNDLKKFNCVNDNCIIPPKKINLINNDGNEIYYLNDGHAGKKYTKYEKRYEFDTVNNGGKFYNNIEATDDEDETEMVLE